MEKQMLYYTIILCASAHMEAEADMMHFHVSYTISLYTPVLMRQLFL